MHRHITPYRHKARLDAATHHEISQWITRPNVQPPAASEAALVLGLIIHHVQFPCSVRIGAGESI